MKYSIEKNDQRIVWRNKSNKIHREDGPAICYTNGDKKWYIEGQQMTEKEFRTWQVETITKVEDDLTIYYKNKLGNLHCNDFPAFIVKGAETGRPLGEAWYKNGKLHREDGPAVSYFNLGILEWYLNGELHREDGPATFNPAGFKEWYYHGRRHRLDGPAIDYLGREMYFIMGKKYSYREYYKRTNPNKLRWSDRILYVAGLL